MTLLDKYNLHGYFDIIVAYEDTKEHKPNPEPLEKALKELGGSKQETIMIGDTDKDIVAANRAGISSILFFPEEHSKFYKYEELISHKPTYVVNDFRKILEIV
jgi:pyrophosphatase PpaX